LLDNTAMSVLKSRFDITAHLERDEPFAALWTDLRDEAARVERCILRITGQPWLLANHPVNRATIRYRDEIILPLLVLVHDAFARYNALARQGNGKHPGAAQALHMALKGVAAVSNGTGNAA
jgi:phosphoenolpyruvate carboxylase